MKLKRIFLLLLLSYSFQRWIKKKNYRRKHAKSVEGTVYHTAKKSKPTPWQVFQKEYGASEGAPNALMHVNLLHVCAYWLTVIHL